MLAALGAVGNLMYNVEAIAKLDKYIRVNQLDKLPVCLQVANTVNVRACSDTRTVFLKLRDSTCRGRLLLQKSVSKSLKKKLQMFHLIQQFSPSPIYGEEMCLFTIHISPKLSVTLGMTNKSKNLFENSVTSLVPCGVSSQLKQDRPIAYILNRCTAQTAPRFLATAAAQPLPKEEKSD